MIQLQSVSKDYYIDKKPFRVLDGITADFSDTGFVCILGPSGCGKTTLLNLIGGLDDITDGDVLFDGVSLKKMSSKQKDSYRNHEIGFIFQNYCLIPHLNVRENITVALSVRGEEETVCKKKADEVLSQVGLLDYAKKKPSTLSGGQAQRVAIARALATDPKVILADEPTGALDSESAKNVMEILKGISKDKLVIMVTHNEDLAEEYGDRIIRLKDGRMESDTNPFRAVLEPPQSLKKKAHLSLLTKLRLSFRNLLSKKGKTVLTGVANSFGMVGIAFFLAINYGYRQYSTNLSVASASSLPVVVTAYDQETVKNEFSDHNASVAYPDVEEIYPSVSVSSQYSYQYNHFSKKYMDYLDSLVEEGVIQSYTKSYGNNYSFNLTTSFPASLDGTKESTLSQVNTTLTSYNYYANQSGLPYNIFHVLYGDMSQYDLIEGSLPEDEHDLVLVVNQYNAVSFNVLKALGFYSSSDRMDQVEDESLATKVKPISFSDVIGKTYKIFDNDEFFELVSTDAFSTEDNPKIDSLGNKTAITTYKAYELTEDFYQNHGTELKIKGILRPKKSSPFTILSPALCYSTQLQETLIPKDEQSQISNTIKNNLVFETNDANFIQSLDDDLDKVLNDYKASESSLFPASQLSSVLSKYFWYYPSVSDGYRYGGFDRFLSDAARYGADLVPERLYTLDFNDETVIEAEIENIKKKFMESDPTLYEDMIGLIAFMNAYSSLQCLVIFPTDLTMRSVLLARLDSFNQIQKDSVEHASSKDEVVKYAAANDNVFLSDVSTLISLVSMILLVFAGISLIVSSLMTMSTVLNSVLERKQEIGLLRALGSSKGDVAWVFEIESFFVGLFSGLVGTLLAYVFSFPLNTMINQNYPEYHVGTICNLTWWHVLIVIALSVILSMLAALWPSYKASRQNPVDSLRNE